MFREETTHKAHSSVADLSADVMGGFLEPSWWYLVGMRNRRDGGRRREISPEA